jgi:hypothetical protein
MEVAMTRTAIRYTLSAVAAVALLSAFAATPSAGQTTTTGSIEGAVTDSIDAAAPTQKPKGLATKKGNTGSASPTRKKSSAGFLWSHLHNND